MDKNQLLLISILAGFLSSCGPSSSSEGARDSQSQQGNSVSIERSPNTLSDQEKTEGWRLLFDGSTLQGWHTYLTAEPPAWDLREGELFTPGKRGDIVTDEEFENFDLSIEWKIQEQGNSGIFYHVVEHPDYLRMHETGPEFPDNR